MLQINEDDMDIDEPKKKKKKAPVSNTISAIQCAFQLLQNRIISNPKDMIGIMLYGTKTTKFKDGNCPHCYLLLDLNVPEANDIKYLKALLDGMSITIVLCTIKPFANQDLGDEDLSEILTPSTEPFHMQSVLFAANILFTTRLFFSRKSTSLPII